jgi:hypothetical protein
MILTLKLLMTPLLITAATLTGRRWGPGASGWLIGFPLTSGPVSIILALQYGREFAAQAAVGTLAGEVSVCVFCLIYSLAARRMNWIVCAVTAIAAFLASTFIWNQFTLNLLPAFAVLLAAVAVFSRWIPRRPAAARAVQPPAWDIPARMAIAVVFVLLLTTFAAALGPQLSGLLSPFPVFGLVLAVFAHRQQGAGAATQFLRGTIVGSLAFGSFFLVVGALLTRLPGLWTYLLAALAAVLVNGASLALMHREGDRSL